MIASIETEKVVVRGERFRKITGFAGVLRENELPKAYLKNAPYFFADQGANGYGCPSHWVEIRDPEQTRRIGFFEGGRGGLISCRDVIPEAEFQELLAWMKRAGAKLAKINRRLAAANADWNGQETIEI